MSDIFEVPPADVPAPPPEQPPVPASAPEATNEYDALLAEAPKEKPVGNEYDSVVIDMKSERQQRLRASGIAAQGSTPEAAAKSLDLSRKTGLPPDLVERNLPKVESDHKLNEYEAVLAKSPRLGDWLLADPINAKVAGDEIERLAKIEAILRPKNLYDRNRPNKETRAAIEESVAFEANLYPSVGGFSSSSALEPGQYFIGGLRRGVETMGQGFNSVARVNDLNKLATFARIDSGEAVPPTADPEGYGDMTPAQRAETRTRLQVQILKNTILIDQSQKYAKDLPRSEKVEPLMGALDAIAFDKDFLKTTTRAFDKFLEAPGEIMLQLSADSAAFMLPTIAGSLLGPVGTFMGSALPDYATRFDDILKDKIRDTVSSDDQFMTTGLDPNDPFEQMRFMQQRPELMKEAQDAAWRGAVVTGVADMVTMGLARPIRAGATIRKNAQAVSMNLVREVGMEGAQEATARWVADQNWSTSEVISEMLGAGPMTAASTAKSSFSEYVADRNNNAAEVARQEIGATIVAATELVTELQTHVAEQGALTIDDLIEKVQASKLNERSPDKMREFLETVLGAEEEQTVFVPANVVATYMQDMTGIERPAFLERLGISEQQIERARVSKEDIAIPLPNYVMNVGEAHKAWRDDIRTEVEGFSVNQAKDYEKTRTAETQAIIQRFEEGIAAGVQLEPRQIVQDKVFAQLKEMGLPTRQAASNAALLAGHANAMATLEPTKYADALDFYEKHPIRFESENTRRVRELAPDRLDILLDSIRSGKDPLSPPVPDAHVKARADAAALELTSVLGPGPEKTPAQIAKENRKAAQELFKADRENLAGMLAEMGVDPKGMSNDAIRKALEGAASGQGRTFDQRDKDIKGNPEGEAEDAKWRSLKPGVTSTGKIKGAPSWVENSRDLTKLRNLLKQFVEEGRPGRFWYENSARTIMRIVRGDILEARKLIGLVALYSPQTPVFTNMNFAIAAYEQYARGEEIDVKTGFQNRAALAWLRDGTDWGGRKTNSFYQNLTDDILANATPEQLAQFPKEEIEESEKRRATVDLWVLRAMGYDVDAAGSAGKRIKDDDSSSTKYGFSENEIKRLAGNLNKGLADGEPRWTPHQVQAALWTAIKARFEIPKVKADTMAESKERGYLVERVNEKTGKTEWGPPAQGAPTRSAHMGVWRKHALKASVEDVKKQVEIAKGAFSDAVDRVAQNITWGAIPSTGISAEINDASDAVKRAFTRDAVALIVDEEGTDLLSKKLGVSLNYFELGTGAYAGSLNPNVISTLIPEKPAGSFDATSADLYARAIQFIFKQDAVPLFRADARADLKGGYAAISPDGRKRYFNTQREAAAYAADRDAAALVEREKKAARAKKTGEPIVEEVAPGKWRVEGNEYALGLKLTYAQPLDNAAETAILSALQKVLGADAGYTRMDDRSVVVINYRGDGGIPFMDDEAFAAGIRAYIEGEGKNHGIKETGTFGSEGRYGPVHDWAADPDASGLSDAFAGRPDLQSWLRGRQQAFNALIADYSGEGLAIREQEIGRAEREGRLDQQGVTLNQEQNAEIISPETAKAAIAAYNDAIEPIKEQYVRYASEKQRDNYATYTLKDMEDMFGDLDEAPAEAVEIVREHGSVVWVQGSENAEPEFYSPADAPSLEDHMEDVVQEQDGVFPAAGLDDINYNSTIAVRDAFDVIAKSLGWTKKGRDSKYFHVVKPIPEGSRPLDEDGEEIKELSVGIRIADHANTSRVGHAVYGKAEVHINIAPQDGMNDAHTLVEAAAMLARARYNEEGKITFAASGREAPLFQDARGSITFDNTGALVRTFAGRDPSTVLHELWHYFHSNLEFMARAPDASPEVKAMYQATLDYAGVKGGNLSLTPAEWDRYRTLGDKIKKSGKKSLDGGETAEWTVLLGRVEQNEVVARAGEAFLLTGKSPSEALASAFRAFKDWLISVYQSIKRLNVPVSAEFDAVMAQMIATREEIEAAQNRQGLNPVLGDAKNMMSEAERDAYTKRAEQVLEEADDKVRAKVMAPLRRAAKSLVDDVTGRIKGEVTAEAMKDPGNAALYLLRNGKLFGSDDDAKRLPIKLSRPALVAIVGEDGLKNLPTGIHADDGMDLTTVAQMVGLGNGQELVERLMQVQTDQKRYQDDGGKGRYVDDQIHRETHRRVLEEIGDPLNDGSLEKEVEDAIRSDKQGALMAFELKILARKAGHSGVVSLEDITAWADGAIAEMSQYQAVQFAKYQRAERTAGIKVQQALLKGDIVAAFKAKQDQLVNFALYKAAKKAAEDTDKITGYLDKLAGARTIKALDQDYLDTIHEMLEEYDFKRRSGPLLAERTLFNAYKAEQLERGVVVQEPPRLKGAERKHFSQMSMEELRDFYDTIKQIDRLGRKKKELFLDGKKRELEATLTEMEAAAAAGVQRGSSLSTRGLSDLEKTVGKPKHWLRVMNAELLKVERLLEFADGDKTGRGIFTRMIYRPVADAAAATNDRRIELGKKQKAIYEKVPEAQRHSWAELHVLPELGGIKLDKEAIIAIALNMGNASNLEKMLLGEKWTEDGVRAAVNKYLTQEEWTFVQDMWDLIDSQWPEAAAMIRDVEGVEPPKIEAVPLQTPYGTLKGGYYPVEYARNESLKGDKVGEMQDSALLVGMAPSPRYGRPSSKAGSTNARTEFNAPFNLSLSVIGKHLDEITHDIFHRRAVADIFKIVSNDRFREAIRSRLGAEYEKVFMPWLKRVANEARQNNSDLRGWDSAMKTLRVNVTMMAMGLRVSTMVQQVAGYANSLQRLGSKDMLAGMAEFWPNPGRAAEQVYALSGEMRHRANNLERDVKANLDKFRGKSTWKASLGRFAFRGIALADLSVSIPTWLGAYRKGLADGFDEADAISYADKMVRDTQGAGGSKDLSSFQDGSETWKIMGMFYSFLNVFYNAQQGIVEDARKPNKSFSDYADIAWQVSMLMIVSPIMAALLSGQGPDDEEDKLYWAMRQAGFGAFSGIPIVRDLMGTLSRELGGKPSAGFKMSPVAGPLEGSIRLVKDLTNLASGEEVSKNFVKNTFNVVGGFAGLPTGQIGVTSQFLWDSLISGAENPENLLDWMRGMSFGPKK